MKFAYWIFSLTKKESLRDLNKISSFQRQYFCLIYSFMPFFPLNSPLPPPLSLNCQRNYINNNMEKIFNLICIFSFSLKYSYSWIISCISSATFFPQKYNWSLFESVDGRPQSSRLRWWFICIILVLVVAECIFIDYWITSDHSSSLNYLCIIKLLD